MTNNLRPELYQNNLFHVGMEKAMETSQSETQTSVLLTASREPFNKFDNNRMLFYLTLPLQLFLGQGILKEGSLSTTAVT